MLKIRRNVGLLISGHNELLANSANWRQSDH